MTKLIDHDYWKMKVEHEQQHLLDDDITDEKYRKELKSLATTIATRDHISKTVFRLKYKEIYGSEAPLDLF